jgi:hypothetical protein
MHYVTTCNRDGFQLYGDKFLSGWGHFPQDASLTWYTEGFDLPQMDRLTAIDNTTLADLQAFKAKFAFYRPPYYLWDVVRFSHKIYAVYDAMRNRTGLAAWIDADMVPFADIPEGWAEGLLNKGDYIALFRRRGFYSECGFWVVDCDHPQHGPFMDALKSAYDDASFKGLQEWHDSYIMDVVVRQFERAGLITVTNLSGDHVNEEHPMAKHEMSKWLDHLKGPTRKKLGVSPENEHRR